MYGMFFERLKFPMFLEMQQRQKTSKKWKNASNDGEPKITTVTTEVNSPLQKSSDGAL